MADNVLKLLSSSAKLDRDKGVLELNQLLKCENKETCDQLQEEIIRILKQSEIKWEVKHGCLMGAKAILTNENQTPAEQFLSEIQCHSLVLLEDAESRVRIGAGMLY